MFSLHGNAFTLRKTLPRSWQYYSSQPVGIGVAENRAARAKIGNRWVIAARGYQPDGAKIATTITAAFVVLVVIVRDATTHRTPANNARNIRKATTKHTDFALCTTFDLMLLLLVVFCFCVTHCVTIYSLPLFLSFSCTFSCCYFSRLTAAQR